MAAAAVFVIPPLSKVAAIREQPPNRAFALVSTRKRLLALSRPLFFSQIDPQLHISAVRLVTCLGAWLAYQSRENCSFYIFFGRAKPIWLALGAKPSEQQNVCKK